MSEFKECVYCDEPWRRIALMIGGERCLSEDKRDFVIYICNECFRNVAKSEHFRFELSPEEFDIAEVLEEIRVVLPQTARENEAEEIWFHQAYGVIRSVVEA